VRVIIVGAGIGGLGLAAGLSAGGHSVDVLERAPQLSSAGGAVTIFPNGARAASLLGVPMPEAEGQLDSLRFLSAGGRRLMTIDVRRLARLFGEGVTSVARAELVRRLAAPLPLGMVRFDAEIRAVQRSPTEPGVLLADGSRYSGDILVGADGINSVVRRHLHGDQPAAPSGWGTYQGLTNALPSFGSGTEAQFLLGPHGFAGLVPTTGGAVHWWFDVPLAGFGHPRPEPRVWLRERFADYAAPVPALLASIDPSEVGFFAHAAHPLRGTWGQGGTTLLGDAAHAFPPSQAQGANQALEDAATLTATIDRLDGSRDSALVGLRLREWEAARSRRIRRLAALATSEITNRPPSPVARMLAPLVPRAIVTRIYAAFLRSSSSTLRG